MERQHKKNPSDKLTQAEERQINNNKIVFHVKNLRRHQVACGCKFSNWTAALMDAHALESSLDDRREGYSISYGHVLSMDPGLRRNCVP